MFAVIRTGGKQYKVSEGETILVDKLPQATGDFVFDQVYMLRWDDVIEIGKPAVSGVSVTAKVLGDEKGEKLRISKFKSKVRYRRSVGFRAQLTRLEIISINSVHRKAGEKMAGVKATKIEKKPAKAAAAKKK